MDDPVIAGDVRVINLTLARSLIGGQLTFAFTNVSGLSFSVLGTNNLMTPSANWPVVGNAVENPPGSGNYQFTDSNPPTNGSRFYLLRQP